MIAKTIACKDRHRIVCKECHRMARIKSKGLCSTCAGKHYIQPKRPCKRCKKSKALATHGLCKECYSHDYRAEARGTYTACSVCGKTKRHEARGLCSACYKRTILRPKCHRVVTLKQPCDLKKCLGCGKICNYYLTKNLCYSCQYKIKSRKPKTMRRCESCGKMKIITARGLCRSCYGKRRYYSQTRFGGRSKNCSLCQSRISGVSDLCIKCAAQRTKEKTKQKHLLTFQHIIHEHGELPNYKWLVDNGYSGFAQYHGDNPHLFSSHPKIIHKTPLEHLTEARCLAHKNGGILPNTSWLNQNGYIALVGCMNLHPDLFKDMPQKKCHRTREQQIDIAKQVAKQYNGKLPGTGLLRRIDSKLDQYVKKHRQLFRSLLLLD